jgi:acyl carrier protein phosphodiesterase
MNILAHLYLSGADEEILTGNFIGDFVKGRQILDYPDGIQQGITLHRSIDSFTDTNAIVRQSKTYVKQSFGKYAGIVIDIFYDHFLSVGWDNYSILTLDQFIDTTNRVLLTKKKYFPKSSRWYFSRYLKNNWVGYYKTIQGVEQVLNGMSKHTTLPAESAQAIVSLQAHYEELKCEFEAFFKQIIEFVKKEFEINYVFEK